MNEIPGGNYIEKEGPIPGTAMSASLDLGLAPICLPGRYWGWLGRERYLYLALHCHLR